MPRFSVIINVKDGAATLRAAIESVFQQTFTDWEVIIWDDGSVDESASIAQAFADPRIRYFPAPVKSNLGRARESAVRQARGEWLAFLDQDDLWLPDKLQKQLTLAESEPGVGMVYGRALRFSRRGLIRDFDHRHEFQPLPEGDIFERLFIDSCFICMSSAVFRRTALQELGELPEVIETSPDYYWFVEIARRYRVLALQEVICLYREHPQSMSHWNGPQMHREAIWIVEQNAPRLDRALAVRRRVIHSTVRAFEEMCRARMFLGGLARMFREGSVLFLMSRPVARIFRAIRRRVRRPYWKRADRRGRVRLPAKQGVAIHPSLEPVPPSQVHPASLPLTLSIIIVNWKVRDLLRDCLRSLEAQMQLAREAWEILVVDNDSQDGSCEVVATEFPWATLLANQENTGFGRANNQAFRRCRGKYVLLLNPDTLILDHAADRMLALMEASPDIAALGCRLVSGDGAFQRWTGGSQPSLANVVCHFLFLNKFLPAAILPSPLYLETDPCHDLDVGWVSGACLMLRRQAIGAQIFDERFFLYCEDLDLCHRLAGVGWRIVYTPTAQIVHYDGRSLEAQSSQIKVSKLRSLRVIFAARNGPLALLLYDLVVAAGFLIRSVLLGLAGWARPGQGYAARAGKSRQFLAEAFRVLLQR